MRVHRDDQCNGVCEYGLPCTGIGITILGGIPTKVSPETERIFAPLFDRIRKFKADFK